MTKLRFAIFFALVAVSSQALAQLVAPPEPDRPLKLNATGSITHDSNLFRLSDVVNPQAVIGSSDKSDNIYRIGAGGSYEFRESRQRLLLEGNVDDYKYQNFNDLDYIGYNARGEWKWQVGNFWDGNLGLGHRRYLGEFANVQDNIKDLIDQNRAYGIANYQLYSRLRLTLDLSQDEYRHGDASQQVFNATTNNGAFTINWVTPAENTVGLQYRAAAADYPNLQLVAGSLVDNSYHEDEVNVVAMWRVSGISNLQARIGYTERKYESSNRDYSAPTWRVTYNWKPTGKLGFDFSTWREIAAFQNTNANYEQITGYSVAPIWSVTPNVGVQGKVIYQSGKFLGNPGLAPANTPGRLDTERIYQLAVLWTPVRKTTVTLALEKGERASNQAVFSYDYNTVGVTAVYTF